MPVCITRLDKFKDLECKLLRLSYFSIKFQSLKNTTTIVKLEATRLPLEIPNIVISIPKKLRRGPRLPLPYMTFLLGASDL